LHSVFENDYKYINIEGRLRKSLTVLNYNTSNVTTEEFFKFLSIIRKIYIAHNYSVFEDFDKVYEYFKFVNVGVPIIKNDSLLVNLHSNITVPNATVNSSDQDWVYTSVICNFYNVDVYSKMSPALSSAAYDYIAKLNVFT